MRHSVAAALPSRLAKGFANDALCWRAYKPRPARHSPGALNFFKSEHGTPDWTIDVLARVLVLAAKDAPPALASGLFSEAI